MSIGSEQFMVDIGNFLLRERIFKEVYSFDSPTNGTFVFKVDKIKLVALAKEIADGIEAENPKGVEELIKEIIEESIDSAL